MRPAHRMPACGHRSSACRRAIPRFRDSFTAPASRRSDHSKASATADVPIPQSKDESMRQAAQALASSLQTSKKRRKKGQTLWPGVKRLSIEIPIADTTPEADLKLATDLIESIPAAAGIPIVLFASQESTDLARTEDVPFVVFSLEECMAEQEDEEQLNGPLLIVGAGEDQCHLCKRVVNQMWSGRLLLVVNAAWMREDVADLDKTFACSLDPVYFFLPITLGGIVGGNKMAYLFRWTMAATDKWSVCLEDSDGMKCVGQMDTKPTNGDIEAMVYNASAANSPLAASAKAVSGLFKRFRQ
eukprot:jgi/Ulvmu1/12489/UM009_0142.1